MKEIYKTIPKHENYKISNKGNVIKMCKELVKNTYYGSYKYWNEKVEQFEYKNGDLGVSLISKGKSKNYRVHKLVYSLFKPEQITLDNGEF